MAKSGVEHLAQHPGWKTKPRKRKETTYIAVNALERELDALHNLQVACQVALRDVPHQKGCARQGHEAAECTCIRFEVSNLEAKLADQLG